MLLKIKVKPNSIEQRIELCLEHKGQKMVPYLKIWLKNPPQKGKANRELDSVLKRVFGSYSFVSGATSREKFIKVAANINNVKLKKRT